MDFEKVKDKYPDSLSIYNEEAINNYFLNPEHGKLNFADIKEKYLKMATALYELEIDDYKNNLLAREINIANKVKKELARFLELIRGFEINKSDATNVRNNLINTLDSIYSGNYGEICTMVRNLKVDKMLESPSTGNLKKLEEESKKKQKEIDEIVDRLNTYLERAKEGLDKTQESKGEIGSLELAAYFDGQSIIHLNNASDWKKKRSIFFGMICVWISLSLVGHCQKIFNNDFFSKLLSKENILEYSIISIAFITLMYMGMSFATGNYGIEKELEIANKHRSNIAKTLQLFLATLTDENKDDRNLILQQALSTLFSDVKGGFSNGKIQYIGTPVSEIMRSMNEYRK